MQENNGQQTNQGFENQLENQGQTNFQQQTGYQGQMNFQQQTGYQGQMNFQQQAENQGQTNYQQQPGYTASKKDSFGFGLSAMVLGIISMTICIPFGMLLGVIGLVFGIISLVRSESKKGMAIAGLITSFVGCLLCIGLWIKFDQFLDYFNVGGLTDYIEEYDTTDNETNESEDIVSAFSGKEFLLDDGSYICFEADGAFAWYMSKEDMSDNYFVGTYMTYAGEDGVSYIVNDLTQFGVTDSEMEEYFERNSGDSFYTEDNFLCLVLDTDTATIDGATQSNDTVRYFMGFYDEGVYDAANMSNGYYILFEEQ